jgi:hypothetical protein
MSDPKNLQQPLKQLLRSIEERDTQQAPVQARALIEDLDKPSSMARLLPYLMPPGAIRCKFNGSQPQAPESGALPPANQEGCAGRADAAVRAEDC